RSVHLTDAPAACLSGALHHLKMLCYIVSIIREAGCLTSHGRLHYRHPRRFPSGIKRERGAGGDPRQAPAAPATVDGEPAVSDATGCPAYRGAGKATDRR